jgi:hypothetical protein
MIERLRFGTHSADPFHQPHARFFLDAVAPHDGFRGRSPSLIVAAGTFPQTADIALDS